MAKKSNSDPAEWDGENQEKEKERHIEVEIISVRMGVDTIRSGLQLTLYCLERNGHVCHGMDPN